MKKKIYLVSISIFCFIMQAYCQLKSTISSENDTNCRGHFLESHISHGRNYSDVIFIPVNILGDQYRMMIKSMYLHRYLTVIQAKENSGLLNDSIYMDSIVYLNAVLDIIHKKKELNFNPSVFDMFVKGNYVLLDKPNPYNNEIKEYGLSNFINKRLVLKGERANNIYYELIQMRDYSRLNEYNLNYLIEALFNYNFIYKEGDGYDGFINIGCP